MNKHSGASLYGRLLALHAKFRPGWKGLPGTNTLAFCRSLSGGEKSLITLTPGVKVIELSFFVTVEEAK
jgi:hypothetical protein